MKSQELTNKSEPKKKRQTLERKSAQKKSSGALTHEYNPLENVTCKIGDSACAAKHVSVIQRAGLFHPMNESQKVQSLLRLQQQYGNRFVQRVIAQHAIQTKLQVGKLGDIYEQEADRVAEQVMRMPEPHLQRQVEPEEEEMEEEEIQTKPLAGQITPLVQRQIEEEEEEEEEEKILQTKAHTGQTPEVAPELESHIHALKDSGQPLPQSVRAFFEPRFGYDFSNVRVHTDNKAGDMVRALNAKAFTTGQDIFFDQGAYNPSNSNGQELLAHELTHVLQQENGPVLRQHAMEGDERWDIFNKRTANRAIENVLLGCVVEAQTPAPFIVQRALPTKTPTCGMVDLFTELVMPLLISNVYLHESIRMNENGWKASMKSAKKGKCESEGEFEDVKLKWDLGNPNLGSYWGEDLNKSEIEFDIITHVIYAGKPCFPCFTGTASWSFNVEISRKKDKKIERGRTKNPIKGSISAEKCDGKKGCAVDKTMKDIKIEQKTDEIYAKITGEVKISGATYSG